MIHNKFLKYIKRVIYWLVKKPSIVKSGAGFTLVEVLVSMAIFTIAVILIFAIYFTSQKFYQESEVKAEILQNGRVVLERLAREIRQSQEIVTALPQTQTPPLANEIEFQDGHTVSPYAYLGSSYYYIRYFIAPTTQEIHRQYKVYCFLDCALCNSFFKWNDTQIIDGSPVLPHGCILEDRVVGEYGGQFQFWGDKTINIVLQLSKFGKTLDFQTKIFGRNF